MKNNYTKEDAKILAEGNQELEKILLLCLEKNILTNASCAGHFERLIIGKRGMPYISFILNEETENFVNAFLGSKLAKNSSCNYNLLYVGYPNLKHSLLGFRLKKANYTNEEEFNKDVKSFFESLLEFLNTYEIATAKTPQLQLFEKLKKRYCRFQLDFEKDAVVKMFIQTENLVPIDGYQMEQKGIFVCYTQKEKCALGQLEVLTK